MMKENADLHTVRVKRIIKKIKLKKWHKNRLQREQQSREMDRYGT